MECSVSFPGVRWDSRSSVLEHVAHLELAEEGRGQDVPVAIERAADRHVGAGHGNAAGLGSCWRQRHER